MRVILILLSNWDFPSKLDKLEMAVGFIESFELEEMPLSQFTSSLGELRI